MLTFPTQNECEQIIEWNFTILSTYYKLCRKEISSSDTYMPRCRGRTANDTVFFFFLFNFFFLSLFLRSCFERVLSEDKKKFSCWYRSARRQLKWALYSMYGAIKLVFRRFDKLLKLSLSHFFFLLNDYFFFLWGDKVLRHLFVSILICYRCYIAIICNSIVTPKRNDSILCSVKIKHSQWVSHFISLGLYQTDFV